MNSAQDPRTVPEGTPAPDWSAVFAELCPHCDQPYVCADVEQHVATAHADLPECTARVDGVHGNYTCVFRAGHAKGHGEYGEWHASTRDATVGRTVWSDDADGATPHRASSEEAQPVANVSPVAEALLVAFDEVQLAEMHASASARVKRVRALHQREYDECAWCSTNDRHAAWPCPTIRALDGEEQS